MLVRKKAEVNYNLIKTIEGLPVIGEVRMKVLMIGNKMIMLHINYSAGSSSPLHKHQHESQCFVISGKIKAVVADAEFILEAGDSCRHPIDVLHSLEAIEDATIIEMKSPVQSLEKFLGTN
tara:strand:+ start:304 stop:666 length:363 start_codon:yes stop_codon:yes gene_type:complete